MYVEQCRHGGANDSKFNGEHSIMSTTAEANVSVGVVVGHLVVVGMPCLRSLSNAQGPKKNYCCPAPQPTTALPSPRILPHHNNNRSKKHHQSSLVRLNKCLPQQQSSRRATPFDEPQQPRRINQTPIIPISLSCPVPAPGLCRKS